MTETQQRPQLDAGLVNAVIAATGNVLQTMAQTAVRFTNVQAESDYRSSGDISAIIAISGETGDGVVVVSFPLQLANLLIARLLGMSAAALSSDDRCDGVGELVNMIGGNVKAALSHDHGATYTLSLPMVIQGPGHEIANRPKGVPYLNLTFEAETLPFHLQVTFKHTP